jgi:hypothetical protein
MAHITKLSFDKLNLANSDGIMSVFENDGARAQWLQTATTLRLT